MTIARRRIAAWLGLALAAAAVPAAAQGSDGRRYAPGRFDALVLAGSATVRLQQGAEDSVFVEGDEEAQAAVEIDVDDGALRLRPSGAWKFWRSKQLQVVVTARDLRRIEIKGNGDVVATDALRLKQLAVRISGSGAVRFDRLRAERLEFNVSGSGTGQLAGTVDELAVRISGRGVYLGENLAAQSAELSVSGAGEVRIWAVKELSANVSGVATIDAWGAGRVTRRNSGLTTWNDHGDKRVP